MGGQVGMGGMGPQFGDQGAPMWRGGVMPMGPQMGGPGGNFGRQNQMYMLPSGQGGASQQPGLFSGTAPMDTTPWTQARMDAAKPMPFPTVNAAPQGMGGMLGGIQGGCPPWMPGCQGGGGYGGGFAASMPMYGGSRPTLQAQLPAQQTPPPPPSGGTTVGYSDAKLKQDIEPLEDGLELVNKLDPVRFNWIGSDLQTTGMIAQQVQEVLPGAVVDMGDGYKGIDGLAVIGALVSAIKTLTTRLEALEAS